MEIVWINSSTNADENQYQVPESIHDFTESLVIFNDTSECEQYLHSQDDSTEISLIAAGSNAYDFSLRVHDFRSIVGIYLVLLNHLINSQCIKNYPKIRGIATNSIELVQLLKKNQRQRMLCTVPGSLPISIFDRTVDRSTSELNGQFLFSQLLFHCLTQNSSSDQSDRKSLVSECLKFYRNQPRQMALLKEFEESYDSNQAIQWYTRSSFLYCQLNRALRTQDFKSLFNWRFFIHDLVKQLRKISCARPCCVYRGQLMSKGELDALKRSIGNLVSINCFFSTSTDREVALSFLKPSPHFSSVLFRIDAHDSAFVRPYADIRNFSCFPDEGEVLFSPGTLLRVREVFDQSDGIWTIDLSLTHEQENELKDLYEFMKSEKAYHDNPRLMFGQLLIDAGRFAEAESYFYQFLHSSSSTDVEALIYSYDALGMITYEKGDYDRSLEFHEKALELKQANLTFLNDPQLDNSYNSIAMIYEKKRDYSRALELWQKVYSIRLESATTCPLKLALCLNNMAGIHQSMGKYEQALCYQKQAVQIREKYLPGNHPDLGVSYSNLGLIYRSLGYYSLALESHNQAQKIHEKSMAGSHPQLATILSNTGLIYEDTDQCDKALTYYEKAMRIYQKTLPRSHPHLVKTEKLLKRVGKKLKSKKRIQHDK